MLDVAFAVPSACTTLAKSDKATPIPPSVWIEPDVPLVESVVSSTTIVSWNVPLPAFILT